jgi:hypothetical protein
VLVYFVYYTVCRYLGRGLLDLGASGGRSSRPPPGPALTTMRTDGEEMTAEHLGVRAEEEKVRDEA